MPARRVTTSLCLIAALLFGSAAGAQSEAGRIRTIDIPPSRPEPRPSLELDLPGAEEATTPDIVEAAPSSSVPDAPLSVPDATEAAQRAIAEAEAAKLRAANAEQLSVARRQLDQITADKSAQQDRLARYREEQAAHAAAMADYEAQLAAARADRQQWEADVAACQAGDWSRCGVEQGPR